MPASDRTVLRALITCCPGSGSTVFAHLLNAHPNILSLHELQLHKPNDKGRLRRFASGAFFSRVPLRRDTPHLLTRMWKVDEGLLAKTLLYMAAYRGGDVLVRELLKHTAKDQVDYVIDKLPDPRLIERFNKKFPDTKLIYLHRNPFAVVNSILRKTGESLVPGVNWGPRMDGAHEGMNHEILSANLYSQCLRWLREAQLKSVSIHEVFYEDFVVDPETVYQGVFDFLDVEVSPGTRRSINQMFDEFPLRKARLDAWRTELTPDVKAEVARELETECALLPERYLVSLETFNADASK